MLEDDEDATKRSTVRLVLAIASVGWYATLWALGLLGCWAARKRYRSRPRSPSATADRNSVPGVSILRPLKGLDPNLYENLESTFKQEYPNFEIFLAVESEHDQALPVVRELMAKYPNVDAHVTIGAEVVGVNPKVNNLMKAYQRAKNDILWVLDSNIMVDSGRRRVALIHHVPFAFATEQTLGSLIEQAFLNTNHARMYIAINTVAIDSCVVGKSNLYRKSDLERVDGTLKPVTVSSSRPQEKGLAAFGRFLAEDNMIASALWHELDLRHDLSCDVARNAVGNMSLADYFWRRVRWIRVRKRMVFAATMIEPFTESVVAGVLASIGLRYLFGIPPGVFLLIHTLAWLSLDLDVYASIAGHPLTAGAAWWKFVGAWAIRESLALPIWLFAIWGSTVSWRGRQYIVMRNGEVQKAGHDSGRGWFRWKVWGRKENTQYEPLELAQD
ncbi:hypothetical protein NM688_g2026 [Phlebia brevispora]|uniref:Uncharacterized protein n=1 Tax=Phlebia brevispora TaxID=194682 RepID=A0ACC1T9T8_9APHY|nr:hypothetical protein NM688_g2026 [Phlebia brevispora]